MGILSRFKDLMEANLNAALEKAEGKSADVLLEQYLRDAKENLGQLKAETAGIIADEMAAGRRVAGLVEEADRLGKYAEQAVLAGNDADAKKFLEGKKAALAKKAEADKQYVQAQLNSDRMRELTKKLNADIGEAQAKLQDLKGKLTAAVQQEKFDELAQKMASIGGDAAQYDSLAEAVQKRIDAIAAKAEINKELSGGEETMDSLIEKYEGKPEQEAAADDLDDELAALKARLGK